MTKEQITESKVKTVKPPEVFLFNGKEYKTEAAMKAAITRAEKVNETSPEDTKVEEVQKMYVINLNLKHNGKRYFKGQMTMLTPDLVKEFKDQGFIA